MHEYSKPSLNKVPFWIADAVFLVAALIIAFSGEPGMSVMEAIWMVFCVTLGALSLIAPYFAEFYTQSRLHVFEHDQQGWERVRKLDLVLEELAEARRQLEGLGTEDNSSEAVAALETRIGVLERHVKDFDERNANSIRALTQQIKDAQGRHYEMLEPLREQITTIESKLDALTAYEGAEESQQEDRFAPLAKSLESLQESLRVIEERVEQREASPAGAVSSMESALEKQTARLDTLQEQIESLVELLRERPTAGTRSYGRSSLMTKAFGGGGSGSSPAIERIIKSEKPTEEEAEEEEDSDPAGEEVAEEAVVPEDQTDDETLEDPIASDEDDEPEVEAQEAEPEPEDEDEGEENVLEENNSTAEDNPLDLDMEEPQVAAEPEPVYEKNKLGQTRITVHALIGIGNKPYVRGDGPGMSWERGIVMDFIEIGKWEWKTMRAQQPFTFQVWLNDEKPAEGEPQKIQPGTAFSISPRFPT